MLLIFFLVVAASLIIWQGFFALNISNPKIYALTKPSDKVNENFEITLIAVGDIMLARTVEQKMLRYDDWLYPFRATQEITIAGDIIFGNLETPLIKGALVPAGGMSFRADPKAVAGLTYAGFNILSLANNHIKNQGTKGINKTIETLDMANINHTGAGITDAEAQKPAIIESKGVTFGFLAYTDDSFTPDNYQSTESRSGSPFLNKTELVSDILKLKDNVDFVIVSMHAGTEYSTSPNQFQITIAQTAIDAGAHLVIGHHPHVVQPMEQYKHGYILYSLGNFIFDQMWSEPTRQSAIASITFNNEGISAINFTPLKIFDYCQPRILTNAEGDSIINRITNFTN